MPVAQRLFFAFVGDDFVYHGLGIGRIAGGDPADGNVQRAAQGTVFAVAEQCEKVVGGVGVDGTERLGGFKNRYIVLIIFAGGVVFGIEGAVTEQQQVLEAGRAALQKHPGKIADGHGILGARGELVVELLYIDQGHFQPIKTLAVVGQFGGLRSQIRVIDDGHLHVLEAVQVLVADPAHFGFGFRQCGVIVKGYECPECIPGNGAKLQVAAILGGLLAQGHLRIGDIPDDDAAAIATGQPEGGGVLLQGLQIAEFHALAGHNQAAARIDLDIVQPAFTLLTDLGIVYFDR